MNKFEKWFLRRIIKREVMQGYFHDKRITNLYREIRRAVVSEFFEDNMPTIEYALQEYFTQSLLEFNTDNGVIEIIMDSPTDIIGRPLNIGDYVVFTNNLYIVKGIAKANTSGHGYVKIMLENPSKTTRPQNKYSKEMCLIPAEDVIVWKLKNNNG